MTKLEKHYIFCKNNEVVRMVQIFAEMLEENIKNIHNKFYFARKMIFTHEDWLNFNAEARLDLQRFI